jgi:hypothetical protein
MRNLPKEIAMNEPLILKGLDAANPLAFLAALGTFRSLSLAWPDANMRMLWRFDGDAFRPLFALPADMDEDVLLTALIDQLRVLSDNPALAFAKDLAVSQAVFRDTALRAYRQATADSRAEADFIAAFACDALADPKSGIVQDTAWRTMSGAGHQHFLGFMRALAAETSVEQLRAALFSAWSYSDPPPSLRWDPVDDRRYALRWDEPSGDPIRAVRGANALAIQAIPLFPTQPQSAMLGTTGFARVPRKGTFVTWPIWEHPLSLDVIRSLLALRELQDHIPPRQQLCRLGIIEVYRSQRVKQGKYRNFTTGVPA